MLTTYFSALNPLPCILCRWQWPIQKTFSVITGAFLTVSLSHRKLLCLPGAQKKAATNAPISLSFFYLEWSLMQEVLRFLISQQVRKPTPSSTEHPHLFGYRPLTEVHTLRSIQFRQDGGTREPWLLTQISDGTAQLSDRGAGGRVMLCERMQRVCFTSSCPWVYWSVITLRGGGRSPALHCPP